MLSLFDYTKNVLLYFKLRQHFISLITLQ